MTSHREPSDRFVPGGRRILLTGASGYVGGRLLRALEARGERVRCLARRPEYLAPRTAPGTDVVAGDVLDAKSLADALRDVDVAYYLVHSMGSTGDFEQEDRSGAENFAAAAAAAATAKPIRPDERLPMKRTGSMSS